MKNTALLAHEPGTRYAHTTTHHAAHGVDYKHRNFFGLIKYASKKTLDLQETGMLRGEED
jgi:hypothetical protein